MAATPLGRLGTAAAQTRSACPRDRWVPDSARSHCSCCGKTFALLRRRHHCRVCGDIVCGKCTTRVLLRDCAMRAGKSCVACAIVTDTHDMLDLAAGMEKRPTCPMFVDLLPSRKWKDVHKEVAHRACSICLDDYRGLDGVTSLPCHHTFHTKCITPWLSTNDECPMCRYTLPRDVCFTRSDALFVASG
ncbi:hypothetical protein SPRG_04512 [Saprolegnia parasitica CBS 223.65]|uniref:RING-type domain-containing protein n=1 Tax=Saprolegnia parasitica (strain CBS 223.65) TaxID=695850 RepID=A0A067CV08_SAPPC|nr:hypothetical protein SPRG_04512 [Saprolegnia parasitica CBS 223.65]KDO30612.1 hypothetical protein SPRG_04512 [Saprolegnia parasitica CBS 223.65]|eukprot:XP_012198823.1 hypothetical protein SPRG_04512 [Saprolegnia parasitica CBS 223.65]